MPIVIEKQFFQTDHPSSQHTIYNNSKSTITPYTRSHTLSRSHASARYLQLSLLQAANKDRINTPIKAIYNGSTQQAARVENPPILSSRTYKGIYMHTQRILSLTRVFPRFINSSRRVTGR